ncbi:MAG: primosomal protein N' [Pseudomonadota bacterium]
MTTRLSVLLPHKLGCLTYTAAEPLAPGTLCTAPLGGRSLLGIVWDDPPDKTLDAARLKPVTPIATDAIIPQDLRRFADFFARYTLTPRGAVARLLLRAPEALAPPKPDIMVAIGDPDAANRTPKRDSVLATLADGPLRKTALAEAAGVSPAVVAAMVKAGQLLTHEARARRKPLDPFATRPDLSDGQARVAKALRAAVEGAAFAPILLAGVTGSGKTEVYFEAIAEALAHGRQCLVLMPEIALTPMVTTRLHARFGAPPGAWHSGLTPATRTAVWRDVANGTCPVVVGARSALFLPFQDLGLIIVDEEHDQSYKQDETVIYHARDMAVARARDAGAPVVLVSATPSLETRLNAESGRYRRLDLPARHGNVALARVEAVDLRADPPETGQWLSPPVRAAIGETLAAGEQTLLFLNRRGYAPLTVCRRCGHRMACPNCTATLVEHRLRGTLMCHHCGHTMPKPNTCPSCGATDTLTPCGPGVERVAEETLALWPQARIMTLSSDLVGPEALSAALRAIAAGEVDIIVGTQLLAKGHTFPNLQLVVVVDADLGLENADPRAAERTFQLLTQVTGRAGRVRSGGRALLQTYAPEHPALHAMVNQDEAAFYAAETAARELGALPPFARLAAVVVSAADRSEAYAHALALARNAPEAPLEVLGPAEAPLALLRGRYRFRLLARAPRGTPLQPSVAAWLHRVPVDGTVRRTVDIDPQSFL